jgi:putative endonuclease
MVGTGWINVQAWAMRRIDALASRRGNGSTEAAHLATGERGEWEALY